MDSIYFSKGALKRYIITASWGAVSAFVGYTFGREIVPEEPFVGQFLGLSLALISTLPLLLTYPQPKQVPVEAEERHEGLESKVQ